MTLQPPDENESPTDGSNGVGFDETFLEDQSDQVGTTFGISTLLSWTVVLAVGAAHMDADIFRKDPAAALTTLLVGAIILGPAMTCIPTLVDHLLKKERGLHFSSFWRIWLVLFVSVYSIASLSLVTLASGISAEWKGSIGKHWAHYLLSGHVGMSLWPVYFAGAFLFGRAVWRPREAKQSPIYLIGVASCAFISFWYTYATLWLNFVSEDLAIVPGSVGVCYLLYSIILIRNQDYRWRALLEDSNWIIGLAIGFLGGIFAKIPLAKNYYESLPDEPPEGCFIVTAASRGHRGFVRSWFDAEQGCTVNQQLLNFRSFEQTLRQRFPRFHAALRKVYNRIGPVVSGLIVFRWQADLLFLMLKPIEWITSWLRTKWARQDRP